MKKNFLLLLALLPLLAVAQPGYITTIAGTGANGFSGDGGPATAATLGQVMGVYTDVHGNVYILDNGNNRIRKINTSGIISTFAGGGSSTAEGIAATTSSIGSTSQSAMIMDANDNFYFADNHRIRKVSPSGIITTVAGTTSSGYSGDGGAAAAAQLFSPVGLCLDAAGNLYIGDRSNYRIRKVNSSGIISTFAGTGSGGYSGDGGPASAAQLQTPQGLWFDAAGNMFVSDFGNYRIRKINTAGIISTVAGTVMGSSGDGGPASVARFNSPSQLAQDGTGNFYVADYLNNRVRKIDPAGIITAFAGGGSATSSGIPATSALFRNVWGVAADNNGNVYIPDRFGYKVCRVGNNPPSAVADSFTVYATDLCTSTAISARVFHYSAALRLKTFFGDGTSQTDTFSGYTFTASLTHTYTNSGTYSIKHLLLNGSLVIDSSSYPHTYYKCATIPLQVYYDNNGNCHRETGERTFTTPITIAVDSNGVRIDSVACTSGAYYNAYGSAGDIYTFRTTTALPGLVITCPSTGIITDTLPAVGTGHSTLYFGFSCSTGSGFDLAVISSAAPAGRHTQNGIVYAYNNYCTPTNSTVTLYHSPKYNFSSATPAPTGHTATTVTWDLSGLSDLDPPKCIRYNLERPTPYLTPGDTVNSMVIITPGSGDADTTNNVVTRIDTVRASYDPNFIESNPSGHIASGITLRYSVGFENDGNDTAQNIYVLDTLSDYLEQSTLKPVFASHEMYIEKQKVGGQTIVKFDFPHIKLLDSTHHGLCEGTFQYDIKVKNGLPDCTYIPARVGIYFDDNPVVMTNEAHNVIGCPSTIINYQLSIINPRVYPNPASDVLNIETSAGAFQNYSVTNNMGSVVMNGSADGAHTKLNIKNLPAGIYCIRLMGEQGVEVRKFVKQ